MVRILRLALLVSLLTVPALAKGQPVSLETQRSATVGTAPMVVRFHATVEPNEHNRQMCFDWLSDSASGGGCVSMDGDTAPIGYWRDITFRSPGEYTVLARVERNDGKAHLSNIVTIRVLGSGQEETP